MFNLGRAKGKSMFFIGNILLILCTKVVYKIAKQIIELFVYKGCNFSSRKLGGIEYCFFESYLYKMMKLSNLDLDLEDNYIDNIRFEIILENLKLLDCE